MVSGFDVLAESEDFYRGVRENGDERYLVLYTGLYDGGVLEENLDDIGLLESPTGLYFTRYEGQARKFATRLSGENPVVAKVWWPEERVDSLEKWTSDIEYRAETYPIQWIEQYEDLNNNRVITNSPQSDETVLSRIIDALRESDTEDFFTEEFSFDPEARF